MRRFRSPVLILACLGLLVSQLSGLHMHVDAEGYTGTPQHTHVHKVGVPVHDSVSGDAAGDDPGHPGGAGHEGEHDVSIVKLSSAATKVLIYFAWLCLGLLLFSKRPGSIALTAVIPPMTIRRARWRPPLRAPPLPAGR